MSLNDNGARVQPGNPITFQLQNFTIDTWIKRASSTLVTNNPFPGIPGGTFIAYGQGGYGFLIADQTNSRLSLTQVGISNIQSTRTITDTSYHHVAVTKSGNSVTFYIDGIDEIPQVYDVNFTFTTNVAIGARGDTNILNSFFGDVDELSVYNRPLTATEIQAIFTAGSAGKCVKAGCDTPSFAAAKNFNAGTNPGAVAVGDFNGDGKPDLAVANIGSNIISVLLGDGTGGFQRPDELQCRFQPHISGSG